MRLPDRQEHGRSIDGWLIVRYDRSGKWWRECDGERKPLSVHEAAVEAAQGSWNPGRPGGTTFDRLVRKLREEMRG